MRLRRVARQEGFRSPYWFTVEEARGKDALVTRRTRGVVVRQADAEDVVFNVRDIRRLSAEFYQRSWEVSPINRNPPPPRVAAFIDDLHLTVEHRIDVKDPTPALDEKTGVIGLPPWELFPDSASYCRALAHEVIHWARRERHDVFEGWGWKLRQPWEEMVADIGAAFLVGDLTGSRDAFEDQVLYIHHWWSPLGEEPHAVIAAAAAAEASVAWLHQLAPGYRAAPVGTRVPGSAQAGHDPARAHGDPMHVVNATIEARTFVQQVEGRQSRKRAV